ncbi:MAG: hypothetical protein MK193_07425 [Lentisphaeria bacterium]|nr:hypothetical protein [Lentisphaeria bacterium]
MKTLISITTFCFTFAALSADTNARRGVDRMAHEGRYIGPGSPFKVQTLQKTLEMKKLLLETQQLFLVKGKIIEAVGRYRYVFVGDGIEIPLVAADASFPVDIKINENMELNILVGLKEKVEGKAYLHAYRIDLAK